MPHKLFTDEEIKMLSQNRYVKSVTTETISFTDEFGERFIKEYYDEGRKPSEIFSRAGIDPAIIGMRRVANHTERWRAAYESGRINDPEHKQRFSESEISALSANPFVRRVNETTISFTYEFKEIFIRKYYDEHKWPVDIFSEAGFDTKLLGYKRIERCSAHWRRDYEEGTLRKEDKSKAKLVKDLEDARRRIAELEEEVRRLKNKNG